METKTWTAPLWMKVLNSLIIVILMFKTFASLLHPEWLFGGIWGSDTAYHKALAELAGRNLAMIALGILVLVKPNAYGYIAVFSMGLVREGFDMVATLYFAGLEKLPQALSFCLFLAAYSVAIYQLRSFLKQNDR